MFFRVPGMLIVLASMVALVLWLFIIGGKEPPNFPVSFSVTAMLIGIFIIGIMLTLRWAPGISEDRSPAKAP